MDTLQSKISRLYCIERDGSNSEEDIKMMNQLRQEISEALLREQHDVEAILKEAHEAGF